MFRRKPLLLTLVALVALYIIATLVLVAMGLREEIGHADVGLVLGSKVNADGTPSARLRARLDRAIELYHEGDFPKIIVSGGRQGSDEAAVMRDYLLAHGIPANQLIVDNSGVNTFSSAYDTVQIARQLKLNSVFVVSQYFHIPRARLALERFGVEHLYYAHAHFFEWRDLYSCPRELAAYARYWFRSYPSPKEAGK